MRPARLVDGWRKVFSKWYPKGSEQNMYAYCPRLCWKVYKKTILTYYVANSQLKQVSYENGYKSLWQNSGRICRWSTDIHSTPKWYRERMGTRLAVWGMWCPSRPRLSLPWLLLGVCGADALDSRNPWAHSTAQRVQYGPECTGTVYRRHETDRPASSDPFK